MSGAFWASGSKKAVSFPMMNFQFCQYMFKPKVGQNSRVTIVSNSSWDRAICGKQTNIAASCSKCACQEINGQLLQQYDNQRKI
jgi:hypothetical protein